MQRVLELHRRTIEEHGGFFGPPKDGCVESSLDAATNATLYGALPDAPDSVSLAVHALFYLAKNHCFPDGNKRIAWATFIDLLREAHLRVDATEDEGTEFVLQLAGGNNRPDAIFSWAAPRLVEATD